MKKLIILAATAVLIAVSAVVVASSASQASQPAAPAASQAQNSSTQNKLSISGSVVAGVTSVQSGLDVTFDFTVKNHGRTAVPGDVIFTYSHAKYVGIICPLVGTGAEISPDTPACEPGNLAYGQTTQSAIIVKVPSSPGPVVVTGCATEENAEVAPQCATLSIPMEQ